MKKREVQHIQTGGLVIGSADDSGLPSTPLPANRFPPPAAPPAEAKGLECRDCGCRHFRVGATRPGNGHIVRHRFCRHCGTRMITREKTA